MVVSRVDIEIARPVGVVWDFLMQPANYALWQAGVVKCDGVAGLPLGSQLTVVSAGLGQNMRLQAKIIANNGATRYTARSTKGPIEFEVRYDLASQGPGTHLEVQTQIDGRAVLRIAEAALEAVNTAQNEADLVRLKAVLESANEPSVPPAV